MRVHTITKSTAAKFKDHTFPCTKCALPIRAGEKFYMYQPNHSQPRRSHVEHGAPKQSELCQGKMSGVYAAIEGAEADISIARQNDDASGLAEILTTCKDSVEEVKNEYEESLGNMPDSLQEGTTGQEIQEKIDALEQFCDELDNAASECEDWDMDSESPQPGEDHTAECASHNETPECDCGHDGQPDSDNNETCSPDCASMQEVYSDCDCGYDELEQEKEQWEQEQKEKINAAFETAENAIGELSI